MSKDDKNTVYNSIKGENPHLSDFEFNRWFYNHVIYGGELTYEEWKLHRI